MPRPLHEIISHIRLVAANPQVSTTLIQTEDLEVLCNASERAYGDVERTLVDWFEANGGAVEHKNHEWVLGKDDGYYSLSELALAVACG